MKHVFWVTLREVKPQYVSPGAWRQIQPYYWYFPEVNEHLEVALDRHPNLSLIDWAAAADRPGITYDAIHLNPVGAALYSRLVARVGGERRDGVADGSVTAIDDPRRRRACTPWRSTSPPSARGHRGFLTAYACDDGPPTLSNHNYVREPGGRALARSSRSSASGSVCVSPATGDQPRSSTSPAASPMARGSCHRRRCGWSTRAPRAAAHDDAAGAADLRHSGRSGGAERHRGQRIRAGLRTRGAVRRRRPRRRR